MEFLFIIYSCKKYLHKSEKLYNKINSKLNNCKILIIYGDTNLESDYKLIDDKYLILKIEDSYEYLNKKTYCLFKTIYKLLLGGVALLKFI
jgi:hypothetical protein